jgi:glycosyltransferase involved in cell wall biosynthesis
MIQPLVSVVTPTFNRRKFIPLAIQMYKNQTYPKNKMEWIIFDDGDDSVEDLFIEASKTIPNIRYIRANEKILIGGKRNRLNREAKGSIIISMDDDDYYPACRVETIVKAFNKHPKVELLGSSEMYLYYTDDKKIYRIGPYGPNHATNGTLAWRKSYSDKHLYDETVPHAEEKSFLDDYKHPMIQIDSRKSILVICHNSNTFDKRGIRDEKSPMLKDTNLVLKDIVKESAIRNFYIQLSV